MRLLRRCAPCNDRKRNMPGNDKRESPLTPTLSLHGERELLSNFRGERDLIVFGLNTIYLIHDTLFQYCNLPVFHHCIICFPFLHYSIIPILHYCNVSSSHYLLLLSSIYYILPLFQSYKIVN